MSKQTEPKPVKQPSTSASSHSPLESSTAPVFEDHRSGTQFQRKIQEATQNSPQAKQLKAFQAMANPENQQPIQPKANTTGLPDNLKSGIENLSGYSMDDVKVHYNSSKPAQLNAHAYAQGTNIHLGSGQEKHLPHEAWHVVQQKQGRVQPTTQMKGMNINNNSSLEKEADLMGAKALTTPQTTTQLKSGNTIGSTIQGKFGFELELTIAIEYADPSGAYRDPKGVVGIVLGEGPHYKIHVDHQESKSLIGNGVVDDSMYAGEGAPIIEVVTDPLDEFDPGIDAKTNQLIANLDHLQQRFSAARGHRQPLSGITTSKNPNLVVGGATTGRQNTNSYTHATYGIKLSQVPQAFSDHADQIEAQRGVGNERAVNLRKAVTAGQEVSDWIFDKYKDRTSGMWLWKQLNIYDIHDQADMDKIKGLLTLIGNYMITYTQVPGKLMKNHTGAFFYKSKLSELIAALSVKQRSLLTNKTQKIASQLTTKCIDQRGSALDTNVNWNAWMLQVLSGGGDSILDGAKNPYSDALGPDQLGPNSNKETGVVVENRHVAELIRGFGRKIPPGEWAGMIRSVKDMLRGTNS